jgi:threonine/homoserine/homoserine lactone efflux protein
MTISELWLALLPILLAMLISPARTIAVILLLHTPKQALTAFTFVLGLISAMMVQGIVLGFLFSFVGLTMEERGPELMTVVSVMFILVGIIMLTGAAKFIFQEEDDDKPPPAWLEKIEFLSPRSAYSTGFGWIMVSPKQWAFVLTAVAVIFTANLEPIASLVNFFIFSVLIQLTYFLIIGIHLIMPKQSEAILDGIFNWIKKNFRPVVIVLFSGFGLFFLIKGTSELIG